MSRDFEFKQLLRAYRSGIISQSTFEGEMAWLEAGTPTNGNGHNRANGNGYSSGRYDSGLSTSAPIPGNGAPKEEVFRIL